MKLVAAALAGALAAGSAVAQGDAARGRAMVLDRQTGFCLLCHSGPFPEERFQGNLGPSLAGVGARLSQAELRQRVADPRAFNPQSIMPAYARSQGLNQVAAAQAGKPLLSPAQLDDVAAFLATLKE